MVFWLFIFSNAILEQTGLQKNQTSVRAFYLEITDVGEGST